MADEHWQRTWSDEGPWQRKPRAGFKPGSGPPPGESYEEMFAKYGRPIGAFEKGREFVYGTTKKQRC